ncbi:cell division topological specificity factor MinE [Candidatus Gastranaerophilales bacterium]|nr:MAG: cell division topological specificity factor MinE [Candidatus Gastranaerophilales bacterium]
MKDIFSDLFNKVFGFFRQTEQKEENAKDTAVNRLRVVLMQDRTNLTPELLEKMRGELIELLSKYVEMDKDALELNFEQEGNQMALMLSIPVLRAKDEEEIEAAEEETENSSEDEGNDTSDESEAEEPEIVEDETVSEEEISEGNESEVEVESNTNTKHSKSK